MPQQFHSWVYVQQTYSHLYVHQKHVQDSNSSFIYNSSKIETTQRSNLFMDK